MINQYERSEFYGMEEYEDESCYQDPNLNKTIRDRIIEGFIL